MTVMRANMADLMLAGLDEVLFEPWENKPPDQVIQAVFNMETDTHKNKKEKIIKGYSMLIEKPEGEAFTAADPEEAWDTTLEHISYGIYSTITKEARDDERYGIIKQFPTAMREATEATINYYASRVFSLGFTDLPDYQTSSRSTTEYLFSTSHAMQNGETQANRPTADVDLTATALWAAVDTFYEMKNEAGLPWTVPPKILLLPHQLQRKGIELLSSEKFPEDANNAINALKIAHKIEPVVWPYWLGSVDPDAWYLLSDKPNHKIKFLWRTKPETSMDVEELTKNILYFLFCRFSCGWIDYKGAYGSAGA